MIENLWYGVLDANEVKPGKPVVANQRPIKSEFTMGENLIQGDAPIITSDGAEPNSKASSYRQRNNRINIKDMHYLYIRD